MNIPITTTTASETPDMSATPTYEGGVVKTRQVPLTVGPNCRSKHTFICPVANLLDTLGKRWILLILHNISQGTTTFNAMRRALGAISSRTLNERLKELEMQGFVERKVTSTRPLQVHYALTVRGASVRGALEQLATLVK